MVTGRAKVVAALAEVALAEERAAAIAQQEYPVGAVIRWQRGRGVQHGMILAFSYHHGPRLRVRNERTGRVYWIEFYDIMRAAGEREASDYIDRAIFAVHGHT